MGNQLTGIVPSQILPVEQYLTELPQYQFDVNLGSTRFFKVARARCKEGLIVTKVFVIHDPSLPLKTYKEKLEDIHAQLQAATNCLPFQTLKTEKAALLIRQFVKDSLYDRISTRPFLNLIEKKWIAYQLLCAINQCHKLNVCHGDIKSENVMITSWNWLLLTDFACFKPTYLPEDNPADFSYFFDASRRRTCYIAPERFVESSWRTVDPMKDVSNLDLTASEVKKGDLTPSMDVFSAGCVIAELFTEGTRPFDLSQLLGYRTGDYSPAKLLQNIDDVHIKELVQHMIQKDPLQRHFAERYLAEQRGKAFPEYFYTFLYPYCQRFAQTPIVYSDDRVIRLKRDVDLIVQHLNIAVEAESPLVIFISLVTSCIRQLLYSSNKLIALELLYTLSRYVSADIVLDRVIPYVLQLVADRFPAVRCEAIRTITKCLADIKSVPVSDANVFPEYILPIMTPLLHDPVTMVRVTYAENIATLAETALGFLEMVQMNASNMDSSSHDHSQPTSYDSELHALHEMIQTNVVTLLTDPDSIVKQTLLQNGITRLCVFFGRQKANDVLLSHMITFLNDKNDWQLRGAFFDNVVGVVTYVGWQSSVILKPLLQQGLGDVEEFVIVKAISAMTSIIELGLLQKSDVQELLSEVARFLIHPNVWIRQNTVGFVATVARKVDIADIHCHILPTIASFLKQPVMQVNQEVIILSCLKDPLPRSLYDHVVRMSNLEVLVSCLKDRHLVRSVSRPGYEPSYSEVDEPVALSLRKLVSQGMTPEEEDKIVALGEFFVKLHKATTVSAVDADIYACDDDDGKPGVINLAAIRRSAICKHVDFNEQELPTNSKLESTASSASRKTTRKKANSPDSPVQFMSEDWKVMFSTSPADKSAHKPSKQASMSSSNSLIFDKDQLMQSQLSSATTVSNEHSINASGTGSVAAGVAVLSSSSNASSGLTVVSSSVVGRTTPRNATSAGGLDASSLKASVAQCKRDVRKLIQKKVEQFSQDRVMADLMEGGGSRCGPDIVKPLPSNWKPKGVMVAHLHEHRGAVNRVRVSPDQVFFATCSNDGTVKLWDCSRIDNKSIANRSRHTYNKQGGQIKTITFCDSSQCLAAASDSGSIHVYRIETASNRFNILQTKNLDVNTEGLIVDMMYFDNGSQNVIVYTTVHGLIVGWDLRSSKVVWKLQNCLKQGLITSFDIHHQLCWLAVGTSKGAHTCWDMRFQLPISTVVHPTGTCVRRLIVNQTLQSSVISSLQGNNEVSMWDMETSARNRTLWASSAPPLSQTKTSKHCVNGLCVGICDRSQFLLTAGTDMRIRYWDTTFPVNSKIVINAATDPVHSSTAVSYRSRLIEGTEVIQETYSSIQPQPKPNDERTMPDRPAVGHHDIITDIAMCTPSQCYIVTSSRDGMVKVWK